jgi:hypothetical protein
VLKIKVAVCNDKQQPLHPFLRLFSPQQQQPFEKEDYGLVGSQWITDEKHGTSKRESS